MNKQFRHFCFTYNNFNKNEKWREEIEESLVELGANYYIWGEEIAPTTGTPHLQGYVQLVKRKAFNVVTKMLPKCHITPCLGGSQDNVNYCNKACTNVVEFGILRTIARARAKQATDWQILIDLAHKGELDRIRNDHPREYAIYYKTFKQMALDGLQARQRVRQCLWIYGAPGTGKSRAVADLFPEAYWKNANKWWDGYRGEDTVILDDLGSAKLYELLKRWADRYKVIGEVKGGAIDLSYDRFIVTSNFHPGELGSQDIGVPGVTIQAVERRFLIVEAIEWDPVENDLIVQPISLIEPELLSSRLELGPGPARVYLKNFLMSYGFSYQHWNKC